MYTVKEVAKIVGLGEHTVRYYTDIDLVPYVERDKNNNRLFNEDSINWLNAIKYLKTCGMSIKSIKKYISLAMEGDSSIEERCKIIGETEAIARVRLEEAQLSYNFVTDKLNRYRLMLKSTKD